MRNQARSNVPENRRCKGANRLGREWLLENMNLKPGVKLRCGLWRERTVDYAKVLLYSNNGILDTVEHVRRLIYWSQQMIKHTDERRASDMNNMNPQHLKYRVRIWHWPPFVVFSATPPLSIWNGLPHHLTDDDDLSSFASFYCNLKTVY